MLRKTKKNNNTWLFKKEKAKWKNICKVKQMWAQLNY